MKAMYQKVVNTVAVVGSVALASTAYANAGALDMSSATTQLGLGLAAVGALGAAKMAPSALAWVWSLLSRVAQR
ncbi:hypothetical protein SAMN02745664_12518 [Moraxella cuniculi DSM 21768]|uniref:Uncharacterized protein n=1 Tax=Moraxella cuniculi DSM 21768 TaxID=1122245 RepID=A0A1N7G8E5_9GAMM|nr:hypothetical protein [Moraxella cuniculi]OOS02660.1 hypothetical protein B0189_09995 [Moraxella cuniculi]SIS08779.1 hypothetical protein SAMN02745664_1258 [Moraxella cuniculi DSM 21768]SIS08860.1 hypothetical protein SAMN02745664_12518 [Moraxella cuniculi DSM 21768]